MHPPDTPTTDDSPEGDEMGFSALDPCECGSGKTYNRCDCSPIGVPKLCETRTGTWPNTSRVLPVDGHDRHQDRAGHTFYTKAG